MIRRIPIVPTVFVLAAVAAMIWLGVWQLHRKAWKESLLARYEAAATDPAPVAYLVASDDAAQEVLFRRSSLDCRFRSGAWESVAGRSARGEAGYVHVALCGVQDGKTAYVQVGWSQAPAPPRWTGGPVTGYIAPYKVGGARLVADPPLAGLEPSARPDPANIPNNHLAYAVQWFLFAGVALIIYALALRKRLAPGGPRG